MASKNYTDVLIGGKIYTLGGLEEESYLQQVASYINEKLAELRRQNGFLKQSEDYQSVMVYLNLADDYFKEREHARTLLAQKEELEKEAYSLKHELVGTQMKIESLLLEMKEQKSRGKSAAEAELKGLKAELAAVQERAEQAEKLAQERAEQAEKQAEKSAREQAEKLVQELTERAKEQAEQAEKLAKEQAERAGQAEELAREQAERVGQAEEQVREQSERAEQAEKLAKEQAERAEQAEKLLKEQSERAEKAEKLAKEQTELAEILLEEQAELEEKLAKEQKNH